MAELGIGGLLPTTSHSISYTTVNAEGLPSGGLSGDLYRGRSKSRSWLGIKASSGMQWHSRRSCAALCPAMTCPSEIEERILVSSRARVRTITAGNAMGGRAPVRVWLLSGLELQTLSFPTELLVQVTRTPSLQSYRYR